MPMNLKMFLIVFLIFLTHEALATETHDENVQCGVSEYSNPLRVFGGNKVTNPAKWPWIASIHFSNKQFQCTASIISRNYILTAAHCVDDSDHFLVSVGTVNYTENIDQMISVKEIISHKNFSYSGGDLVESPGTCHLKSQSGEFDIALLKLSIPLKFSETIRPICLSEGLGTENEEIKASIVGWGRTDSDTWGGICRYELETLLKKDICNASRIPLNLAPKINLQLQVSPMVGLSELERPSVLNDGHVNVLPGEKCEKILNDGIVQHGFNKQNQICEHGQISNVLAGDSGGPLLVKHEDKWFEIGLASHHTCSEGEGISPDVYTGVSAYCGWISDVTQGEVKCQK